MEKPFLLETERLQLREITAADAPVMYELNRDPEVIQYTGDEAFESIAETETFIRNYQDYARNGYGRWAVVRKEDGATLGWCGLKYLPESGETDIGYRFFKKYWGQGYATEAAKACLEFGFNKLGLEAIVARAMHANLASINVMKKLGMTYRNEVTCEAHPAVCYQITKPEFYRKFSNLATPETV